MAQPASSAPIGADGDRGTLPRDVDDAQAAARATLARVREAVAIAVKRDVATIRGAAGAAGFVPLAVARESLARVKEGIPIAGTRVDVAAVLSAAGVEDLVELTIQDELAGSSMWRTIVANLLRAGPVTEHDVVRRGLRDRRFRRPAAPTLPLDPLDLSYMTLRFVPDEVLGLTALQDLKLSVNSLQTLPERLFAFTSLQCLDLDNNDLTELPPEISALTALRHLNLYSNALETLPSELFTLPTLIELNLSDNRLAALPEELSNLTTLQHLYLADNRLATLPRGLSALGDLTSLALSRNLLTTLPRGLSELSRLRNLSLSGNPLADHEQFLLCLSPRELVRVVGAYGVTKDLTEVYRGYAEVYAELLRHAEGK